MLVLDSTRIAKLSITIPFDLLGCLQVQPPYSGKESYLNQKQHDDTNRKCVVNAQKIYPNSQE